MYLSFVVIKYLKIVKNMSFLLSLNQSFHYTSSLDLNKHVHISINFLVILILFKIIFLFFNIILLWESMRVITRTKSQTCLYFSELRIVTKELSPLYIYISFVLLFHQILSRIGSTAMKALSLNHSH